jgi:hypothetical protein
MNTSPIIHGPSINLWTLGHRRYYSPSLRTVGGLSAVATVVTSRVRPSLVLRSVSGPTGIGARKNTVSSEK